MNIQYYILNEKATVVNEKGDLLERKATQNIEEVLNTENKKEIASKMVDDNKTILNKEEKHLRNLANDLLKVVALASLSCLGIFGGVLLNGILINDFSLALETLKFTPLFILSASILEEIIEFFPRYFQKKKVRNSYLTLQATEIVERDYEQDLVRLQKEEKTVSPDFRSHYIPLMPEEETYDLVLNDVSETKKDIERTLSRRKD